MRGKLERSQTVDNCSVKEEQSVPVSLRKDEKIDRNLAGNEMCPTEHTDFIILKFFPKSMKTELETVNISTPKCIHSKSIEVLVLTTFFV